MDTQRNYIQNTRTSGNRNLRIEFTGQVTENEKNFLSGISYFTASTIGRKSDAHLRYVSGIMFRLARFLTLKTGAGR